MRIGSWILATILATGAATAAARALESLEHDEAPAQVTGRDGGPQASRDELAQRLAALEARVGSRSQKAERRPHAPSGRARGRRPPARSGDAGANAGDRPRPTDLQRREARRQEQAEQKRAVESRLAAQHPDPQRRAQLRDSVGARLQSHGLDGTGVEKIRCGTTLCRLDMGHDSARARKKFLHKLSRQMSWEKPFSNEIWFFGEEGPDGTTRTRIYVARDGYHVFDPSARP